MHYLEEQAVIMRDRLTRETPQSEPIPFAGQVKNSAGGYVWEISKWDRLTRFLILGSDGGTYYASGRTLTVENANCVMQCIEEDGIRSVDIISNVSSRGRAAKNDPALFALAMCASFGNAETKRYALDKLPMVARIATHLFHFVAYAEKMRGWGRSLRVAVAKWYQCQEVSKVAYQLIKYRQRDGWTHRDLMRLSHPKPKNEEQEILFRWAIHGDFASDYVSKELLQFLAYRQMLELSKSDTPTDLELAIIKEHRIPRECIPTDRLKIKEVWTALLDDMPMTAMIRNLATMTRVGLFDSTEAIEQVCERITHPSLIENARVHPIQMLSALMTYGAGKGQRSSNEWKPVREITQALEKGFYLAFKNVRAIGNRVLVALDISGSMDIGEISGVPGLTPRLASAAMSMIHHKTERDVSFVAFCHTLTPLKFDGQPTIIGMVDTMKRLDMGRTDCSLPIQYALHNDLAFDTFIIYTDNETWAGSIHPAQALYRYRETMGINAKLIVVGMTATSFSIADPNDPGMLDVVGFDTATPQIMSQFSSGEMT